MKKVVLGLSALLLSTAGAFAMDPATESVINGAKVYTTPQGMTLYTFDKDGLGNSTCTTNPCSTNWLPFTAPVGAIADGDDWTLVARADGTKMWAHHGKPLYTYVQDKKPGDVSGEGVSTDWHVATPD